MDVNKNIHSAAAWSLICAISIMALFMILASSGEKTTQFSQTSLQAPAVSSNKEAIVVIDYGNGKIRRFKGPALEQSKVWDLFQQAIAIGGINVEITDRFVPLEIGGFKNGDNGKQWNLYVNNVKKKFSPFKVVVKPGDEIVFKFE